jgi:hypothetical protein
MKPRKEKAIKIPFGGGCIAVLECVIERESKDGFGRGWGTAKVNIVHTI